MKLHVLAIGQKMPAWVDAAVAEYSARMPAHCALQFTGLPAGKRGKGADLARITREEGARLQAATPRQAYVVALDVRGRVVSTEVLAERLQGWLAAGRDVALWVGGPEGLSEACLAQAHWRWSLSPLTFAHPVVRVILAEQLYRAWSVVAGLPYHRGNE